jgi:molybdopterin/thiamine biosynthesis adenylyltransferase
MGLMATSSAPRLVPAIQPKVEQMQADRYARQQQIEWWDQARLRKAHVLVAGVGALGNEVLKNLALLGVGHLLLVDADRIETSNLSRTVLFNEHDVGQPKVAAAAAALAQINPETTVTTIDGDLFYDVGLGYYCHCDVVIGCLDNLAARSQVGRSCGLAGIPYLDGGMWSLGGEVRWFAAEDGPCFDCTLSADHRERAGERRSCTGFRLVEAGEVEQASTVATTASIIGGILAQEAVKWLCGYPVTMGRAIVYNGQALTLHRATLTRNPNCAFEHSPYQGVITLADHVASLTARQLLVRAQADLEAESQLDPVATRDVEGREPLHVELGRDFLIALHCRGCGRSQPINRLWGKVAEDEQSCPDCGIIRDPEVIRALNATDPYSDRPLAELGVPPREVLAVHTPTRMLLYELAG